MRRKLQLALCLFCVANFVYAVGYGSLNNFDAVNDTGVPCHGFEIEIDDIHSSDITYTYDWNHYGAPRITEDNSDPLHPKVFVRYMSAKNPDGSWAAYTAVPAGPIAPTDGHQFTDPTVNFGGEHFGVGFYGATTNVKYHWLIDDGSGNLVFGSAVNIGTPTFTYYPPVNNVPAQVQAAIQPAPPAPEVPVKEFGEPTWMKVITTQTHNNGPIMLEYLVSEDPDDPNDVNWRHGEPDEIEVEWQLMQTEFSKADGGANGEQVGAPEELPEGDEVITRRYEFYKYVGPLDPESGEADTDSVGPDDIHGEGDYADVVVVGDWIGSQMAGFDPEDRLGLIDNLQSGAIGEAYIDRRLVIGGTAPVLIERLGALPAGMEFDLVTGILSGTPAEGGLFTFTINVADGVGDSASKAYQLLITDLAVPVQRSISTTVNPLNGGTTEGAGTYDEGSLVTITAKANPGFQFINWTEGGQEVSANLEYSFVLDADRTINANFAAIPVYRNLSDLVSIGESGKTTSLDRRTRMLTSTAKVTLRNQSETIIDAPIKLIIKGLPAGVSMPESSGKDQQGNYYYDLEGKLSLSTLLPGDSAQLTLKFVYSSTLRISYTIELWGMAP